MLSSAAGLEALNLYSKEPPDAHDSRGAYRRPLTMAGPGCMRTAGHASVYSWRRYSEISADCDRSAEGAEAEDHVFEASLNYTTGWEHGSVLAT